MEKQTSELDSKLFIVLFRTYRSLHEIVSKMVAKEGLHITEFGVLELIYHKGEQPLQQIGSKILLASGSITYVVDKLEKKNLLKRMTCSKDKRITYAQITEEGREVMDRLFPMYNEKLEELMGILPNEEKEQTISTLKKLGLFAEKSQ